MSTITKETLRDSHLCRLCGQGQEVRQLLDTYTMAGDAGVIPLYEKCHGLDAQHDTEMLDLDEKINRYLPIKVRKTDPHYPQVICSSCFTSLQETVHFFDKIIAGQRILINIINQTVSLCSKASSELASAAKQRLAYEHEKNVILQSLPKRRGRPRKDDPIRRNEQRTRRTEDTDDTTIPLKPKRISRPPERYAAADFIVKGEESDDKGTGGVIPDTLTDPASAVVVPSLISTNESCTPEEDQSASKEEDNNVVRVAEPGLTESEGEADSSDASVRTIDLSASKVKPSRRHGWRYRRKRKVVGKFKCTSCDKAFMHRTSLKYHHSIHHGDPAESKKFKCELCAKPFPTKTLLANHLITHSTDRPFNCDLCIAKFKNKSSLYIHRASVHSGKAKPFRCGECGNQFSLNSSLKAHMRLHTNEKPYVCDICKKAFTQRSNMREHRRIHTGERPYQCKWADCEKKFVTSTQLRMHEATHSNVKLFYCDICGKGLVHSVAFQYHMKCHNNERDVVCSQCSKRFITKSALKVHMRVHTGEKPYKCDKCERAFTTNANCEKHKKIHIALDDDSLPSTPLPRTEQTKESTFASTQSEMCMDTHEQVIYIYPDSLPIFTVNLEDNQAIEVRGPDGAYQMLTNLDQIAFATIDRAEFGTEMTEIINVALEPTALMPQQTQASDLSTPTSFEPQTADAQHSGSGKQIQKP